MRPDDNRTEADAVGEIVRAAAAAGAEVTYLDQVNPRHPFIINPHTGTPVSLAAFLDAPLDIEANHVFSELESFTAYVTTYKREGAAMFAKGRNITAVLDYHEAPDKANGCKHSATLMLAESEALREWKARNGKAMSQLDFVEFLEDREREIVEPVAAAVREIAQELHVVSGAQVKSCVRSGSDMRVEFTSEQGVRSGKNGTVEIPTKLLVRIQPFDDQPAVIETVARLRLRIREQNVVFTYQLEDLDRKVREAFEDTAKLAAKAAAVPVFI